MRNAKGYPVERYISEQTLETLFRDYPYTLEIRECCLCADDDSYCNPQFVWTNQGSCFEIEYCDCDNVRVYGVMKR